MITDIDVEVVDVTDAEFPPIETVVAPPKFRPLIVTALPPSILPKFGLREVILGAELTGVTDIAVTPGLLEPEALIATTEKV